MNEEIITTLEHSANYNNIVIKDVEHDCQLVSSYNSNGTWINKLFKNENGELIEKGQAIKSKVPLWEVHKERDTGIKKMFVAAGIIEQSNAQEKTELLTNMILSITEEQKMEVMILLPEADVMPADYIYVPNVTYKKFINKMKENFEIDDESIIVCTMATMLTNMMKDGDPVWLLIVAPASGGKTELIRAITPNGRPNRFAHPVSTLTPSTFISGLSDNIDLLPRIDGKILCMKDFTTILSKQKDTRNEILGQLREIYDGYFSKETGSGVGFKGYSSHITLIAGVTPMIDRFSGVQSLMGERFIRVRQEADMHDIKSNEYRERITEKAARLEESMETPVRIELSNYMLSMMSDFEKVAKQHKPSIPTTSYLMLQDCANITAVLRTGIERDFKNMVLSTPEPEFGPRLAKIYKKQAKAIAWLLGKKEVDTECFSFIYRIALDTVEKTRINTLKIIEWEPKTTLEISTELQLPTNTTKYILEDLWMLNLIERIKPEDLEVDENYQLPEDIQEPNTEKKRGRPADSWCYNRNSKDIDNIIRTEYLLKSQTKNRIHHYEIGISNKPKLQPMKTHIINIKSEVINTKDENIINNVNDEK